ncbi:MAG: PAS domain-containing protein, partial [Desulfobaccales bacterium]
MPELLDSANLPDQAGAASDDGFLPEPEPPLDEMVEGIYTSLQDLKAAVREAQIQPGSDPAPEISPPDSGDMQYRTLFDEAPEGFLVTDGQMVIQEGNRAAAALFQVEAAALRGRPLLHFIAEADRAAFQISLIQVREGGEKRNWPLRLQLEGGEPFPVFVSVRSQRDRQDRLL